jgi:hypothetical protein
MLKRVDENVHAGLNLVDDDRNPTDNTLLDRSVSGGSSYEDRDCLAVQVSTSDGLLGSCAPEQLSTTGGQKSASGKPPQKSARLRLTDNQPPWTQTAKPMERKQSARMGSPHVKVDTRHA